MTFSFQNGRYSVGYAKTPAQMQGCLQLRERCFLEGQRARHDPYDDHCDHLMVTDQAGRTVATARLFHMQKGADAQQSYAAQRYDLRGISALDIAMLEVGRFCISPDVLDADVLRVAWGALAQIVDARGVKLLFGCTSFAGTDPFRYGRALGTLRARYLGPEGLRPAPRVADAVALCTLPPVGSDPMPPLLRTYLAMGGWISDHAVIDHAMNTLHVFTCLAVENVPPARARMLRALAEDAPLS